NIEGTAVDYPVVRAEDNLTYIDHSFNGKRNSSGAIFMDYRCNQGFDDPLCLIYGHNMKDGSMFHTLISYLDPEFREAHLKLTIITHEGQVLPYRISDVRWTDAFDQVFFHEISQDAEDHLLILSTCSSDVDPDARLLVFAKPVEDK
ncbi:MAG: class B sortase, partial [Symbiobacteriaceae bacterium]|nr:class B sortase [Symbiobacteriaceae bacterium]